VREQFWRRDAGACAALFVLAATVRVLFLLGTVDRDLPFSIFYYGDSRAYRELALAILRGEVFDHGIPFHPPGFAYALAMVIGACGERPTLVRAVLAIASASSVPLAYLLGLRIWGRAVAWTGALLTTFSFGLLVTSVSANTETIYIPILAAQALLLVLLGDALAERRRAAGRVLLVASGIVLGIGALTRAEHLAMAVLLPTALWVGWRSLGARRVFTAFGVLVGVAAVVLAPWTIHSYRSISRFNVASPDLPEPLPTLVLVSGYGPLNFALANNPRADGTFRPDSIVATMGKGRLDFRDPRQMEIYRHGYRLGREYLTANPREAIGLVVRKLDLAADAFALGFGLSNWPGGLRGTRRSVDLFTPEREHWKPVSVALAALGLYLSRSRWRRASIVWLGSLDAAFVAMAFFGYARFFVAIAPLACCLQAVALVTGASCLPSPRVRRVVAGIGAALAAALLLELALAAWVPRNFRASGIVDSATGKILQDAAVEIAPVR